MKVILRDADLRERLAKAELITITECTAEENKQYRELTGSKEPLPDGVFRQLSGSFAQITPACISNAEELNLIEALKTKNVISIKKWVTFFGVLMILSLIGGFIAILATFA